MGAWGASCGCARRAPMTHNCNQPPPFSAALAARSAPAINSYLLLTLLSSLLPILSAGGCERRSTDGEWCCRSLDTCMLMHSAAPATDACGRLTAPGLLLHTNLQQRAVQQRPPLRTSPPLALPPSHPPSLVGPTPPLLMQGVQQCAHQVALRTPPPLKTGGPLLRVPGLTGPCAGGGVLAAAVLHGLQCQKSCMRHLQRRTPQTRRLLAPFLSLVLCAL